jgi:Mrp family chromosome partitioning ATPase
MLSSVVRSDSESGLNFLPLGNATLSASRTPDVKDIAQKLSELASQVDLVIIDSGAMLTDEYVRPFAEFVDDIVFVVRSGGPKRNAVLASLGALRINARKLRGAVLTGAEDIG